MCNFPSWIVDKNKKVWFLTDKDIEAYCEHQMPGEKIDWYDFVGHHGIINIFGIDGDHVEGYLDIPVEIASAISMGKMKKMMEGAGIKEFRYNPKDNTCFVKDADGNRFWYKNNKFHRTDGPAVEYADGSKFWYKNGKYHRTIWYKNGKYHRTNGPAIERVDGTKEWYKDGRLHRDDGPAIECFDGTKKWFKHGNRHRDDGPAIEHADGSKVWYKDGFRHRLDGPAVEHVNGTKEYWVKGIRKLKTKE
jgi:hypothetical protein